jgi:hypothetical protein
MTSERCVIVVDEGLPAGLAANAAAVLALTLGAREPSLVGAEIVDGKGETHPGLIPMGLPVLAAPRAELGALREAAVGAGLAVIDFPTVGQQTTDYEEFRATVARTSSPDYLGVVVHGPRKAVARLTGRLSLLR